MAEGTFRFSSSEAVNFGRILKHYDGASSKPGLQAPIGEFRLFAEAAAAQI